MNAEKPVGVVLLQLGGPESLETVEPFLRNLFCDPDIIDMPLGSLLRRPLAELISRTRAPKVREFYRRIGGRSPILKLTRRQARALEQSLAPELNAKVVVAMRYWHPLTDEALDELSEAGVEQAVLLPLYPHFSRATTGSSINAWKESIRRRGLQNIEVEIVSDYCDHPLYIAALIRNIRIALNRVPGPDRGRVHLVFSAHGTPMSLVLHGDPYQGQIVRTYTAVIKSGNFGLRHHLCYQSKVGPQKWLKPSLTQTIARLAMEKVSHVIVVPIAFVSDHSETLWEINIETRREAKQLGIRYFDMSPALHTAPQFIGALKDLVLRKVRRSA
ncbi:MAG TPA: ferrochelatase [Bacteroidota bacterium]|nr:ferrochelatase [Bacteroidota bacterium]